MRRGRNSNCRGSELRSIDVHNGTSKFDLGLFVVEKPDGLHCMVEYSTDLFDSQTMDRFLGHFEVLLEGITANPDQAIADLPILTPAERQQIVVDWNRTEVEYPRTRSLHQFIEEQVEKTPDAPALVFESKQLTYRELNARANQLAHHLRKMGVGPEVLVGICAERSLEMVIGLLGIVKAGGAYVPLDPDHPRDRLAAVIEDAAPPVLLTQEHLLDVLPAHNAPVICLDRDWKLDERRVDGESQVHHDWKRSGVCDFHFRIDGQAEGSAERPRRHCEPAAVDAACVWPERQRPRVAEDAVQL